MSSGGSPQDELSGNKRHGNDDANSEHTQSKRLKAQASTELLPGADTGPKMSERSVLAPVSDRSQPVKEIDIHVESTKVATIKKVYLQQASPMFSYLVSTSVVRVGDTDVLQLHDSAALAAKLVVLLDLSVPHFAAGPRPEGLDRMGRPLMLAYQKYDLLRNVHAVSRLAAYLRWECQDHQTSLDVFEAACVIGDEHLEGIASRLCFCVDGSPRPSTLTSTQFIAWFNYRRQLIDTITDMASLIDYVAPQDRVALYRDFFKLCLRDEILLELDKLPGSSPLPPGIRNLVMPIFLPVIDAMDSRDTDLLVRLYFALRRAFERVERNSKAKLSEGLLAQCLGTVVCFLDHEQQRGHGGWRWRSISRPA